MSLSTRLSDTRSATRATKRSRLPSSSLRLALAPDGRQAQPADRFDGVFGDAVAVEVHRADHELGVGLARAGGESQPANRLVRSVSRGTRGGAG